jgi:hypothetical protein
LSLGVDGDDVVVDDDDELSPAISFDYTTIR